MQNRLISVPASKNALLRGYREKHAIAWVTVNPTEAVLINCFLIHVKVFNYLRVTRTAQKVISGC